MSQLRGNQMSLVPLPESPREVLEASPDRASFVLVALDRAKQWLVTAQSVEDVKELQARAEAMRVYARQAELGREAENAAAEIRLRAERRVGELLGEGEPSPGPGRGKASVATDGLSRDDRYEARQLAAVTDEQFEERLTQVKDNGRLSRTAILRDPEREAFDALVTDITPADYDPTFDNAAVRDVGQLDAACERLLELAGRWSPAEFAGRYRERRTIPALIPTVAAARDYLAALVPLLESQS